MHSGPIGLVNNPEGGQSMLPDQGFFDGLNGELTDKGFLVTSTEELFQWARTGSLWWMTCGRACCAGERSHVNMPRDERERFGAAPRAAPRGACRPTAFPATTASDPDV